MAEPLEWNRYQVFVENRSPAKFSDVPGVVRSLNERPSKSPIESGCRFGETYEDDKESSRKLNTSDAFVGIFFFFPSLSLPFPSFPALLIFARLIEKNFTKVWSLKNTACNKMNHWQILRSVPGENGTERRRDGFDRLQDGGGE